MEASAPLRGLAALKAKYERVAKTKKPLLADLEVLCLHSSGVFDEEKKKQILAWRDDALWQLQRPSRNAQPKSKPCKRKAAPEFDADAQVMKLLEG